MAGFSLLALLDDITSVLDDVAAMTKVAAQKTAGVLGDDLAVNAEQVSGVRAERELPVVWSVAKGSFINKAILVPAALLLSAFAPWLVSVLLMLGGAYLCYEGAEKLHHKFFHPKGEEAGQQQLEGGDIREVERKKIRGAIRTDFILSAEIIIIALGSIPGDISLAMRAGVLALIGIAMTFGVYGLVGGIVKLDDMGFWLLKRSGGAGLSHSMGKVLISAAPLLMRVLAEVGTVAMLMVGGGILTHGLPFFHGIFESLGSWPLAWLWPSLAGALLGLAVGSLLLGVMLLGKGFVKR